MRKHKTISNGYFDATALFRTYHPDNTEQKTGWKVSHYTDNQEVKDMLITLNKPAITEAGRYGFTQLPLELYDHYKEWIITITLK